MTSIDINQPPTLADLHQAVTALADRVARLEERVEDVFDQLDSVEARVGDAELAAIGREEE